VVLAQLAISSQLIDNLNASIHLRALLTDLFLLCEILRKQSKPAVEVVTSDGDMKKPAPPGPAKCNFALASRELNQVNRRY
jgi:hypothetical protein